MLRELSIRDYAVIEELRIDFYPGLNILTGETGAGKSIIIDALSLLLGSRAQIEAIRSGKEVAVVEGSFDIRENEKILQTLNSFEIEIPEKENVIIRREITKSGRSKCYLNGNMLTVGMLQEIGNNLVDIHGQHEHQAILSIPTHIDILDKFGNMIDLRKEVSENYREWERLEKEIASIDLQEKDRIQHIELYKFQIDEIEKTSLKENEEEELKSERKLLLNAQKRADIINRICENLYSGEYSMINRYKEIINCLKELASIDKEMEATLKSFESLYYTAEDISSEIKKYKDNIKIDPERHEFIEGRLTEIGKIKRKYGSSCSEVMDYLAKIKEELIRVENYEDHRRVLDEKLSRLKREAKELAIRLSDKRGKIAKSLREMVETELQELGMKESKFDVMLEHAKDRGFVFDNDSIILTSTGIDRVEFLISTNPGEELKPLARIASGGELSRTMLALKTILANIDDVSLMIFDEVDSGIGGRIAEVVGRKLFEISRHRQVICITHLAQIASYADRHYYVFKKEDKGRMVVLIKELEIKDKENEIARMIGGEKITPISLKHAREMLQVSENFKTRLRGEIIDDKESKNTRYKRNPENNKLLC